MSLDLVVLGNLLVDDIVFPDGTTRMGQPGGAVLYVSLGASLWGLRVGVVSWRGDDYPARTLQALVERRIDLTGVHPLGRPGLRTWLLYEGRRRQVLHHLDRPSHAEVSPTAAEIPTSWNDARAFHVAPMPFDVQKGLVASLSPRPGAIVSLDPYLLLRPDTREAWSDVLSHLDAFFLSEDEMEIDRGGDACEALASLARERLRFVLFKRGGRGGLLYDARKGGCAEWTARSGRVVDATGAGDAFTGGFLAGWLLGEPAERALRLGVVSASFAVEEWGPAGLLAASPERARARLSDWFGP